MSRQHKTPRQRAEEQLAVAERAVTRLGQKKAALEDELYEVESEHAAAIARRNHYAAHPDLPHNPATSTGDTHQ